MKGKAESSKRQISAPPKNTVPTIVVLHLKGADAELDIPEADGLLKQILKVMINL